MTNFLLHKRTWIQMIYSPLHLDYCTHCIWLCAKVYTPMVPGWNILYDVQRYHSLKLSAVIHETEKKQQIKWFKIKSSWLSQSPAQFFLSRCKTQEVEQMRYEKYMRSEASGWILQSKSCLINMNEFLTGAQRACK